MKEILINGKVACKTIKADMELDIDKDKSISIIYNNDSAVIVWENIDIYDSLELTNE